jgi:Tol biopolymer transport system component
MRYRGRTGTGWRRACLLVALVLGLSGCMHGGEEAVSIPPLPAMEGFDPGLGPGTRSVSSGPGYKSAPSWAPKGDRISFILDGYVVDESVDADDDRRWTTKDFGASKVEWTGENSLAILGDSGSEEPGTPRPLYRATYREGSLDVDEISTQVRAMSANAESGTVLVALGVSPTETALGVLRPDGDVERVFTSLVRGVVTGICPASDGEEAVLAVRGEEPNGAYDLHTFDLETGEDRRVASLGADQQLLGTPQWTEHGAYYVAAEKGASGTDETALYKLYRVPTSDEEGRGAEPAPGVGEDFIAASVRASPDGERLAVVGRLTPNSPTNLYVLDPDTQDLSAMTTNEDMEVKTGPHDIAWSPGGDSVAIVARGAPSGEPAVRDAPAQALLKDFFNVYEIPVNKKPR